MKAKEYEGKW